ncbi:hypothetical protein SCA6_008245 [Theobroma cacao]
MDRECRKKKGKETSSTCRLYKFSVVGEEGRAQIIREREREREEEKNKGTKKTPTKHGGKGKLILKQRDQKGSSPTKAWQKITYPSERDCVIIHKTSLILFGFGLGFAFLFATTLHHHKATEKKKKKKKKNRESGV